MAMDTSLATPALSRERIAAALTRIGINHVIDEDGDPVSLWDGYVIRFVSVGASLEMLQARSFWSAQPPLEMRAEILEWINTWHMSHHWPMGFFVSQEGFNAVVADVVTDFECGVSDAQLEQFIRCVAGSCGQFYSELAQTFPQFLEWIPADSPALPQAQKEA